MVPFQDIGRLPTADDNCAIAVRTLAVGTDTTGPDGDHFRLSHTILEGHRFAVRPIPAGAPLLSWGMTFGRALHDITPGEYVCNAGVLQALKSRSLDFALPGEPNFADDSTPYHFDAVNFRPAPALPRSTDAPNFMGIRRPGDRGVGTRNMIVLLGINSLVNGFIQRLEKAVQRLAETYDHIDGIVGVTHTEGGQAGGANQELLLRTLAGFMVHPNVAAVLAIDAAGEGVVGDTLTDYAKFHGYALHDVLHRFISLRGPFARDLARGTEIIEQWLPQVNAMRRTAQPLGELKIALQCGGSDAFSGVSGNPLAALVAKDVIQAGGSAVLAETDELIGAESYVLNKVRDAGTAQRFLEINSRFQEWAAWHGHSAHGNPTGGNKFRGLYNIYLKSLGAAAKRHPDVRLDHVIEYSEPLPAPGYTFMDSPGNDLESIAGQVASGCNIIFFVTGNGSITNFPFVPTIKIVTTSGRYALLADEMDMNAGAYLDGTPLADLAREMRDLALAVAAGQRCAGEKAGHAQVQIWRAWPRAGAWPCSGHGGMDQIAVQPEPSGRPLPVHPPDHTADFTWRGIQVAEWRDGRVTSDRVGLILPASLCSGQIARMAVQRLNEIGLGKEQGISRFAALVHTEGCGSSIEPELVDTLLGYMAHPLAATCLVLEHGCEITHNDFWRGHLRHVGLDPRQFGWASVQLDGGIKRVLAKITAWFAEDCRRLTKPEVILAGFEAMRLGLMAEGNVDQETGAALAALSRQIVAAGGTVILPFNDPLLSNTSFTQSLSVARDAPPTITFAQQPTLSGLHVMANPTAQWSEIMTGLGAAGVEIIIATCTTRAQQGHPFIPVLQVSSTDSKPLPFLADMDLVLSGSPQQRLDQLLAQLAPVLSHTKTPKLNSENNISFQITRGRLGISL